MEWTVEEVPHLRGYTVEWAETGNYYLSRRNRLFWSADLNPPFKQIAVIHAPGWRSTAARFRLGQRLLRFMVTNVLPLSNDDLFITFDKAVGIVHSGQYLQLNGLVRPCRVLRSAACIDEHGDVYFGEYLANTERGEMRVYRYTPGSEEITVAHVFLAGSIRHIHGIYFDQLTNAVYCLTGDEEKECHIFRSTDRCETFEVVGEGDETWRAVSILFDDERFFYGTDAEFRANNLYSVDRQTLERNILGEVSGTVFYSKRIGPDKFFTTTAENAPSQKENVAALWHVNAGGNCTEIAKFKKDPWHRSLFMFGTIHFPNMADGFADLYFHLVGVEGDNCTYRATPKA